MTKAVVQPNVLPMQGAFNFRDMGGFETVDGRKVKKGILFRAAELSGLTVEDIAYLEVFQLKYIFDYRDAIEADKKPDPVIGEAIRERVAVNEDDPSKENLSIEEKIKSGNGMLFTKEQFIGLYETIPLQNPAYQRLMTLLRHPEEHLPLVHHCAGGRDRTGVGAMIILMTLGVPYETIMKDYMFSNECLLDFYQQIYEGLAPYLSENQMQEFKEALPLQESYLEASMKSILSTYGTFDRYLEEEYGINQEVREMIKDFCLE